LMHGPTENVATILGASGSHIKHFFLSPPEGGLDLVTNRQGAI